MKVKIKKLPSMANGGNKITMGGFKYNQVVPNYIPNLLGEKPVQVVDTLSAVPVEQANVEAEQGETVVVPNQQGLSAHYKIGGKRHSEGGTPLDLPDDSFIFSDTKGMKIKDKKILEMFGESSAKTPAQIAKKYDINKQRKTLSDPLSDKLQKETAEKNIANYNYMLGKLALVQESMKGFPQGVPFIAQPYLIMNQINPMDVLPFEEVAKSPAKSVIPAPMSSYANEAEEEQEMPMDMGMMRSGGSIKVRIKNLPMAQHGLQPNATSADSLHHQMGKSFLYEGNRGSKTGTGLPNFGYNQSTLPNFKSPSTLNEAMTYAQQEYEPKLVHYGSATEKGEAFDFLYNTGKDPRKYALQEYYKQYEPTQLNKSGEWEGRKTVSDAELDKLYKNKIGKLKENDRRLLLNKGRDWYYKNSYSDKPGSNTPGVDYWSKTKTPDTNKQYYYDSSNGYYYERGADGSLSPAYGKSWYGRIWNTNDYKPFDPKNPNFIPKKMYGGDLPKAQNGRSTNSQTGDVIGLNKNFWDTYQAAGQQGLFQPDLPYQGQWDAVKRQRKETQGAVKTGNTKNIYGDLNWTEGPEWEDFKRRHQWYLKDNPDFDPHSKSDVEDFQKAYIKKAEELGVDSSYFATKKTKGLGVDGLFGEHTWSAPGFNPAPKKDTTIETDEPEDEVRSYDVPNVQEVPARDPFGYFPQDAARMFGIASQQIPNPRTFYAAATPEFMNPAYLTEDYSPISEQTAIAANALGTFGTRGGSQGLAANLSKIQGNTARQAADHALQVKNQNVGIYNTAEQFNTQVANANNQWNQVQKAQNFDTQEAYKANRIMAKNKKLADFINASIERENNAIQAYNLNITSPYFKVDPTTGGMVSFYNPKAMKPNAEAMASEISKLYKELKNLNMPEETIQRVLASKIAGTSKIHDNEYMPDYSHMMYPFS